jgi:hypothetical protein
VKLSISASERPRFLSEFKLSMTSLLGASSDMEKNTFPSLSMVICTISFAGATLFATELGVTTARASAGLNFVARIKNDNRRKATSHIAVMSTAVLFLGNFTFGIFKNYQL